MVQVQVKQIQYLNQMITVENDKNNILSLYSFKSINNMTNVLN